jgi:hypothetical protein
VSRPRLSWPDDQLREIMDAIVARDRDFPLDNARFLEALVDDIRATTGRLYGATTYVRLLRDLSAMTGVTRCPSAPTIQKAIARAQALAPTHTGPVSEAGDAPGLDVHTLRRMLEPMLRDTVAPLLAQQVASVSAQQGGAKSSGIAGEATLRLQLTEAALEDAHARIRRVDDENARLRRELGEAEAARDLAGQHVKRMLEDLHQVIAASASGSGALARVAEQLAGTERFLKSQNDAVRLQASSQAEALRHQVTQLRERVDHLLLENDQYRRALAVQRSANS